jgi:hypothetical protein
MVSTRRYVEVSAPSQVRDGTAMTVLVCDTSRNQGTNSATLMRVEAVHRQCSIIL